VLLIFMFDPTVLLCTGYLFFCAAMFTDVSGTYGVMD
jgi:hypothetical protein